MQKHQSSHPQVHAWNTLEPNTCNKITNHSFLNRIYTYKKMHKKIIWFYANANPNVPSIGNTTWCAHLSGSHLANPKSEICSSFRIKCLLCTKKKKFIYVEVHNINILCTSASSSLLSNMFEALMSLWMILLGQSWWRYCKPLATPTATLNLIFHAKHSEPEMLSNVTFFNFSIAINNKF